MTRRVHLIRHAMPQLDPATPPDRWGLSAEGRAAARALRGTFPPGATVLSSDEPKAIVTALEATGARPVTDPRFGEVGRPAEPFDAEVRDRRRAWVCGRPDQRHRDWESREMAGRRFAAAIAGHPGELVVATHGMVLTAWLIIIGQVEPGEAAGELWAGLRFPDVLTVEV